jgi:hypothetical protein
MVTSKNSLRNIARVEIKVNQSYPEGPQFPNHPSLHEQE